MNKTAIEWTDFTWNTTHGCTRVSEGCRNCYAESLSRRFGHSQHPWTKPFEHLNVKVKPEKLREPFSLKEPARVFVDSMSDLFHPLVPASHIGNVFAVMATTPHLTYQILTKRPERMAELLDDPVWVYGVRTVAEDYAAQHRRSLPERMPWPLSNVWLGTSVEDQRVVDRIDWLVQTPAAVRFLSCEPLIGPLDLSAWLYDIGPTVPPKLHWVIAGGESGPHHRPIDPAWVRRIRDDCDDTGTAFFFKQWGGRLPKAGGRLLDGIEWNQFPEVR